MSLRSHAARRFDASPSPGVVAAASSVDVRNPADRNDHVGSAHVATPADIDAAIRAAATAQPDWNRAGAIARAGVLVALSDRIEHERELFVSLLVREAGKTIADAVSEVREAVDYCRYYAELAVEQFATPTRLPGPTGESNELSLHGRGVFACISPWNFPLAIFLGQITAALAAGNAVVAKPAPQTPLIGAQLIELARAAGVPDGVLQYLPGDGAVGAALVSHPEIAGVAFTGSTQTARAINRALAQRDGAIVPLIAETGGQNALFVDSTALLEQLTDDVMRSAFGSAGQRCSSLRLLLLQDDIADRALEMIRGAMRELRIGDPADLATDVGPLIDDASRSRDSRRMSRRCAREGCRIDALALPDHCANGSFMAPHIIEIDDFDALHEEHFGPVLHVARFAADALDATIAAVRAARVRTDDGHSQPHRLARAAHLRSAPRSATRTSIAT